MILPCRIFKHNREKETGALRQIRGGGIGDAARGRGEGEIRRCRTFPRSAAGHLSSACPVQPVVPRASESFVGKGESARTDDSIPTGDGLQKETPEKRFRLLFIGIHRPMTAWRHCKRFGSVARPDRRDGCGVGRDHALPDIRACHPPRKLRDVGPVSESCLGRNGGD